MNILRTNSCIGYATAALLVVGLALSASAISITKGNIYSRNASGVYPDPLSGITYAGSNSYYAVADNGATYGLYTCTINLSEDGKTISSFQIATTNDAVKPSGTSDLEGVAYDPSSGNVWLADESRKTIKEYTADGAVVQTLDIPNVMKNNASNYGFESLTISGDGLTLWTCNEEALTVDGDRSSYSAGTTVRLVKYTRATVRDRFELAAMYPYTTEKWTYQYNYSDKARCGVADLCALPDGSLLVLERELSFSSTSSLSIYLGASILGWKIYHVANPDQATDVKDYASLQDGIWAKEIKTLLASDGDDLTTYGNFEGICLGPRLSNGNLSVLLISDSGDGWSQRRALPLVLSGLNVRTLNFEEPTGYTASIKGSNYRYLNGAQVTVGLTGPGVIDAAYTNNGETVATTLWAMANQSPASGSGATATFTVGGDGTLTWAVATSLAVSPIVANDSFEAYAAGTQGDDIPGWSGEDAEVVETNYATSAGYPMAREAHTKVLKVDGDLTRTYPEIVTNVPQTLEFMLAVRRAAVGSELVAPQATDKIVIVCDSDGRLQVNCKKPGGTTGWVELSSTQYANDDWIRVTLTFDYASNGDGRAFVQIKLGGTACTTGVASPTDPNTAGGGWYELLKVGEKRCVSALVASGACKLDDVILSVEDGQMEPAYIDGVPVVWLDALGLGRDPNQTFSNNGAYTNLAARGYTLGDAFDAGIDLTKDEPFQLTDVRLVEVSGSEGKHIQLTFNGVRDDKALADVYHVYYAETLGGEETPVEGTYTPGDGQTIWVSTSPVNAGRGFYRVTATR